jgi:hypothetical protein
MSTSFTQNKYKDTTVGPKEKERVVNYFDGSDSLARTGYRISIQHVSSETAPSLHFKAFITSFNDTFSQNWNSQEVYGRADPIYNFKNTNRKISLGFKMVASSESEAYENLTKAQKLAQYMYPNYTDIGGAKTVSQSPLIRLSIMNLLQTTDSALPKTTSGKNIYESYEENGAGDGVLGFFDNVTFNWNLENSEAGVFQLESGSVLPKLIEISIGGFSPIHEQHLGWDENGRFGHSETMKDEDNEDVRVYKDNFPYGASTAADGDGFGSETALGQTNTKFPKPAYSEDELSKDERAQAEAAIANAQARYGGMFGNMRRKRDQKRLKDKKLSGDKGAYITSALIGQKGIDAGVLADGQLSNQEIRTGRADPIDFVED